MSGVKLKFSVDAGLVMRFRDACQRMGTPQTETVRMLVRTFTEMVETGKLSLVEVTAARKEQRAAELKERVG